ncbi:anti-sigma-F factor Fin family protein [Paenibacillus rhizophilus]|uniref:Anti-sigma-F factor Fin family protein n=1 Tax=Paenibacillus rhizophilus TaxID=1850366 RepID=A0A3N9PTC6_9BACL|nr:anti-sigma-F factor Fin family protein [Paenibacillus rhizophilus]RQW08486.1 anti-sigma-F factor Fin family protein [Paenibacillus rhizophilus]
MAIHYVCRHCRTYLGTIRKSEATETQLGLNSLTPAERRDIIAYDSDGEITVKVTCDYCKQALDNNPELSLLASPLQ